MDGRLHAGVVTARVETGDIDEQISIYRGAVATLIGREPGLQRLILLVDRNTGKSISIGIWESEEAARQFESSGRFQDIIGEFKDRFIVQPAREVYEVAVDV